MWVRLALLAAAFATVASCGVEVIDRGAGSGPCETLTGVMTGDEYTERSASCDSVDLPDPSTGMQAVLDALPDSALVDRPDAVKQVPAIAQSVCISLNSASDTEVENATSEWLTSAGAVMTRRQVGDFVEIVSTQSWCSTWQPNG